jgi:hypothetical protein
MASEHVLGHHYPTIIRRGITCTAEIAGSQEQLADYLFQRILECKGFVGHHYSSASPRTCSAACKQALDHIGEQGDQHRLFASIALLGLAISDNFWLDRPSSRMYYDSLSIFVMGTLSTVLTIIAVRFANSKSSAGPDGRFVLLQILIALAAFAYVLNLMRTHSWS